MTTIAVPHDLVEMELKRRVPDGSVMAWITVMRNPYQAPEIIQERWGWDDTTMDAVWNYTLAGSPDHVEASLSMMGAKSTNATPNVAKNNRDLFVDIIYNKMNEYFPNQDAPPEAAVKNFLVTLEEHWGSPTDEMIDSIFAVMEYVDTNKKPVDYPLGFMNYLVTKNEAGKIIGQAAGYKARPKTQESVLQSTMRQAERALKDVQPPSPSDNAELLKKMRARIGNTQPSSR